jgi:hypothetical protein
MRHVVMFSSGAGSAVAGFRVADRYGTHDLTLLFADVNGEHGDNYRFLREAAEWVGGELVVIDNGGKTIWQVFSEVRFLGNSRADPCSRVLKREPMRAWLDEHCDPADTTVHLGFDWTEQHRLKRAEPFWAPWHVEAPLCWEPMLDKAEALECLAAAGVEPPWLTRQGFPHANCGGGCVKAGIKQFKMLLRVSPDEYARWEWNEERQRAELGDVAMLVDRTLVGILRHQGLSTGDVARRLVDGKEEWYVRATGEPLPKRVPLPLRQLRLALAEQPGLFADEDWGGCNCFTPIDEATA